MKIKMKLRRIIERIADWLYLVYLWMDTEGVPQEDVNAFRHEYLTLKEKLAEKLAKDDAK